MNQALNQVITSHSRNPEFFQVRLAVMRVALLNELITADHVQAALEKAGEMIKSNPNIFGSAIHSLAKQGYLQRVGYVKSDRKPRHSGVIAQWKWTRKPFDFVLEGNRFAQMALDGQLDLNF